MERSQKYRRGIGVVLINSAGSVWAGRRSDFSGGSWQMPQGGIDPGEDVKSAFFRELEEETSIKPGMISLLAQSKEWISYNFPTSLANKVWSGRYIGQEHIWFLAYFKGSEIDINIETETPEFEDWCWMKPSDLVGQIIEFKQEAYTKVFREFDVLIKKEITYN
tara:strand:- start:3477 stop:3968 length:492 start_codon:yes stop_codon:yes gene_type:complete